MKTRQNPLLLSLALGTLFAPLAAHAESTWTRTSAFTYDSTSGLLVKEVIEPDDSTLCLVTQYTYDAYYGNKTASTTRNCNGSTGEAAAPTGDAVFTARTSSNAYDARGQFPVTSTNALGQSENKTYDARFGSLTKLTGPNGLATTFSYDNFGRKILETRADGTQTKWEYLYCSGVNGGSAACPTIGGAVGKWLIQETPLASNGVQNGPVNKRYFDALNREIRAETQGFDGNGTATAIYKDTQYDSLGRPYKVSRPYDAGYGTLWSTVTYDALGRVIQETQPDDSIVQTSYSGLTTTITDPLGRKTSSTTNSQGKVVKVVDAQNNALTYSYDPFDNLRATTDPRGNVVSLTYDLRGRKINMLDPDMGWTFYAYNALGELVRQTDAKGQVSTMVYDRLGRLTQRSENDLISNWYYDAYKGGAACQKGIGKLCQAETSTGYNRTVSYDTLGRQTSNATTIDVTTPYTATASYDTNGRIATQTYPSGLVVKYVYTTLGYLKEVRDNASNALYWRADSLDAEGHLVYQTYGNNVVTLQARMANNGRPSATLAGAGDSVQSLWYQYDKVGNLTTRIDRNQNLTENFTYDSLNRLTSSTVNSSGAGIVTKNYSYDTIGNITSKSDLGAYAYTASGANGIRPHAVSQVTLSAGGKITFAYDANGALTTQTQTDASNNTVAAKSRSQFYTSFNMPQSMAQGTISAAFYYGPEHQRVKQISSAQGTTVYVNPDNEGGLFFEKDIKPNGSIEQRSFINAGGQAVAIVKTTTAGGTTTKSTSYLHRDALGSITAITNESGAVIERLAYEPFGKRRFASGANDPNNTIVPQNTDRGFTGHEMLDEIGLIHMNGRVYDPLVGRFLSADPSIQLPYNLQNYNRYSYTMNNPLGYTDPSGYGLLGELQKGWKKIWHNPVAKVVIVAAVSYFTAGTVSSAIAGSSWATCTASGAAWSGVVSGVAGGAAGGFAGGLVGSGWDVKAGLQGAGTALLFYGAGSFAGYQQSLGYEGWGEGSLGRAAAHAVAGCIGAAAGGGSCGSGALSAGFAEGVGGRLQFDTVQANLVTRAVIGGTASVIGGGKFANGATTAAFGYLFNLLAHVGFNARLPFIGGGSAAVGVSWNNGEWDAGLFFEGDILGGPSFGKMIGKAGLEVGLERGDFDSQRGDINLQIEAHYDMIGSTISKAPNGSIDGGSITIGPGLGFGIGGTRTNTMSIRQIYREIFQPITRYIKDRLGQ